MSKPVLVKVSRSSEAPGVAGAIAGMTRQGLNVDVRAIGPYAITQAVKAIALATQFLYSDGISLRLEIVNVVLETEPRVPADREKGRILAGISFLTEYDFIGEITSDKVATGEEEKIND